MNPQQLFRQEHLPLQQPHGNILRQRYAAAGIALVLMVLGGYFTYTQLRVYDMGDYVLHIEAGMTGRSIAATLRTDGVVRSTFAMRTALALSGKSHTIKAGNYTLDTTSARSVFALADMLVGSSPAHAAVMVTVPEGSRGRDILAALTGVMKEERLEGISEEAFDKHIGYLFPNTYAIDEATTVENLVERMRSQYETNIAPLRERIATSGLTEAEVITFASIVEREANDEESMRRVAGIIYNRLKQGMRLQVDATLTYLLGKTSAELTQDDLARASPYNSYQCCP